MKTTHTPDEVRNFLETTEHAKPGSIEQLSEGHISQAIAFESVDGDKQVLRISAKDEDFLADQYASQKFGGAVPIPRVIEIGTFGDSSHYCISEFVEGTTTNKLSADEMRASLDIQNDVFAKIFQVDVSSTSGYGHVDIATGNAAHDSWKSALSSEVEEMGLEALRENAKNIGLDPALVDRFMEQFQANLDHASEVRRLLHGDLGFDNLIVDGKNVNAVIDWAQMAYGDWMHDYAKFDFWWPDRYTDPKTFTDEYDLDAQHLPERMALYWATTALGTIRFADRFKSKRIAEWLHEHVAKKLI